MPHRGTRARQSPQDIPWEGLGGGLAAFLASLAGWTGFRRIRNRKEFECQFKDEAIVQAIHQMRREVCEDLDDMKKALEKVDRALHTRSTEIHTAVSAVHRDVLMGNVKK